MDSSNRSESRQQQTLTYFNKHILEKTGLGNKSQNKKLTQVILETLVRRLDYSEANDFVSQLPQKWKDELLDLPAGPDRNITAQTLVKNVQNAMGVDPERALLLIRNFCEAICELIEPHEFFHVAYQLPKEMQIVLLGHEAPPH